MRIISVAVKSTFAGHAWLAKHVSDVAIVRNNDQLGTDNNLGIPYLVVQSKNSPSLTEAVNALSEADAIIIFGSISLHYLLQFYKPKSSQKLTIILSDSFFLKNKGWVLEAAAQLNSGILAMPDLFPWLPSDLSYRPFYQYVDMGAFSTSIEKEKDLFIAHSPGKKYEQNSKGSSYIESSAKEAGIDLKIIRGMSWHEACTEKAKSQVFVDQCIDPYAFSCRGENPEGYVGGLGKSGIEAMKLKCLVLSSGESPRTQPFFPPPPVIWSNPLILSKQLKSIKYNLASYSDLIAEQFAWANIYCSSLFVSTNILNSLPQ